MQSEPSQRRTSSISFKCAASIHLPFALETDFFFLILNFRRVLIVVSFLLGKSPASVY